MKWLFPLKHKGRQRVSSRTLLSIFSIGLIASVIGFWNLATPAGFSPAEKQAVTASNNARAIVENPLHAPHKTPQYIAQKVGLDGQIAMRGISVLYGIIATIAFYLVARQLFGTFVAYIAALGLLSTPLYLLATRHASPEIMYAAAPVIILAIGLWVLKTRQRTIALYALVIAVALSLYVPGMLWCVALGYGLLLVNPPWVRVKVSAANVYAAAAVCILLISPLLYGLYRSPELIKELFLLPEVLNIGEIITQTAQSASGLIWRTNDALPLRIGHMPILSIIIAPLCLIGIYAAIRQWHWRSVFFVGLPVLGIGFAGLSGNSLVILYALTALLLLFGNGLFHLLKQWYEVFPRNSLAGYFAVGVICIMIGVQLLFGVRSSIVAWPATPPVTSTYVLQ